MVQRRTDREVGRLREIASKRSKAPTELSRPNRSAGCPPGYEHYNIDWGRLSPKMRVTVQRFADVLREIREHQIDLLKLTVDSNRATITELQILTSGDAMRDR